MNLQAQRSKLSAGVANLSAQWPSEALSHTVSSVWVVTARSQIGNRLVAKTSNVMRKMSKAVARPRPKRPPIRLGEINS